MHIAYFLRCVILSRDLSGQDIFFHIVSHTTGLSEKKMLLVKQVYWYFLQLTFVTFLIPRNIQRIIIINVHTWSDKEVRELIVVKVLHTSLLNTTVVAFKVLPLGSYASMPAPSPPFKTILKLVLWNGLQSCRCITPDVISVIKMPSFQYFLYLREQKKVSGS